MALPEPTVQDPRAQRNWDWVAGLFFTGKGSPEGRVPARAGALYTDQTGGAGATLYVKESGSAATGWAAK